MSFDSLKIICDFVCVKSSVCIQRGDIFSWAITFGDILTIIGFFIATWQFTKQMKEARKVNDAAQRENWFLNVIVLPQLNPIQEFYKELIELVITQQTEIKDLYTSPTNTPEEFNVKVANIKNECKEKINTFYDHIVVLVKSYDKQLGSDTRNQIMELEDICTSLLDNFSIPDKEKIRRDILDNKQKIISVLNTGMKKK